MKKVTRLLAFLIVTSLVILSAAAVFADTVDRADPAYYVYDDARLLSENQWSTLNDKAKTISEKYNCGLYIVTVEDFNDYTSDDEIETAAENIYSGMDFGIGDDRDGQMLMLSMDGRDYAMIAFGDYANYAFTDYGKDLITDEFLDNLGNDDWYGGFIDYLDESERLLKEAANGQPVDILVPDDPYEPSYPVVVEPKKKTLADYLQRYLVMLLPSSLASLITCSVLRSKSKNVRTATNANRYIDRGLTLYASNDMFMHRSQTRRVIPRDTGSHSGGGGSHFAGTTVNSHGFSGKSGKF